jgi:pimeloyl-ACP methyl ester carboxylesterase
MCVHGLTRNSRDFDELAAALAARGCRVVCMDVVGRGDSAWLEHKEDYGFAQYLADAAALLARLTAPAPRVSLLRRLQGASEGQRIDWVGTSMGGLIGMMIAAKPNSPIRRLVLNDVAARSLAPAGLLRRGEPECVSRVETSSFICAKPAPALCLTINGAPRRHSSRRARKTGHALAATAVVNAVRRGGNAGVGSAALPFRHHPWPVWGAESRALTRGGPIALGHRPADADRTHEAGRMK